MFTKQIITLSLAALATFGAFAMSVEQAAARSDRHGFGVSFRGGHDSHRHWGHQRHRGFYDAPVYVSEPVVRSCYFVRRSGGLYKVCPVY